MFLATIICSFVLVAQAFAHATLVSSSPADGAIVAIAPPELVLIFNEPVAPLVLKLVRPDGLATSLDGISTRGASLAIAMPTFGEGTHVLSWRVVSADGHPVGGSLVFSLGAPSASGPPTVDAPAGLSVAAALWLAKVALFTGLFVGVGGAFFLSWLGPADRGLVRTALGLGLAAAVAAVGLQGVDALQLPLSAIAGSIVWRTGFDTSFGNTALIAAAALVLGLGATAMRRQTLALPLSTIALAGVGLALAASGHAADAEPHWLTRPAVFLHAVGITVWIGALAPLASGLSRRRPEDVVALERFSRWIPLPLAMLVAAGGILAVIQVETPSALVTTGYGRVLLAKLAVVAVLLARAARNRWRLTRPILDGSATAGRAMVRAVWIEMILVVAVLAAVALWRFTPPPRVIAIEAARPAMAHLHGDKAMADVSIAPGSAGETTLSVFVMTPAFEPLPAKQVTVRLAATGAEPFKRSTTLVDGVWRVEQLAVPFPGRWTIGLDVLISDFEVTKLEGTIDIRP